MVEPAKLPRARTVVLGALLAFLAAFGLRITGIFAGLPHIGEPDTYIVDQARTLMDRGLTDRYRAGWKYPHLVATIAAATAPFDLPEEPAAFDAGLPEHLDAAAPLLRHVRVVSAVLSSLVAPATFLIALRFFTVRYALLAALLASVSLLHICFSWQGRPHGPVSGMAALAVLGCIRWSEKPTLSRALVMGLGCAASLSTLHTGAAALGPFAVASIASLFLHRAARGRVVAGSLLAALVIGAFGAWFYVRADDGFGIEKNPEAFVLAASEGEGEDGASPTVFSAVRLSGHPIPFNAFNGRGFPVAGVAYGGYDPVLGGLAFFGILAMFAGLRRWRTHARSPAVWCVVAFTLPTLAVLCGYALSYPRFFLLLTAPLGLFAAAGVRWLSGLVQWRPGRMALRAAAGAAVLVAGFAAAKCVWLRLSPDTFARAAEVVVDQGYTAAPFHTANLGTLPLFVKPSAMLQDRRHSGEPWDIYQWDVRRRAREAGVQGPADRLGVPLIATPVSDYIRMLQVDDKTEIVREQLASSEAETVLLGLSPKRSRAQMAESWDAYRDALDKGACGRGLGAR